MFRRSLAVAAVVAMMFGARPASGGERRVSKARRAAAVGAAVVPGAIARGAGHFVLGERAVARRLLHAEGIGLGIAAAGGVPLILTGASRHYTAVPVALLVSGAGVLLLSWAADLYGASGAAGPRTPPEPAPVELELGYGYVQDPRFDYASFAVAAASVDLGPVALAPVAWIALDDDNQRLRLEGRHAFWRGDDASRLEVTAAATHHRYPDDGFAVSTLEASVGGRLDMARVGGTLAGSFADLSLGLGAEVTNYYTPGAGADLGEILLVRFGYGVAFGCPGGVHGEASIYYDHRRDTFAGGISPGTGPGSGFMGLVGGEGVVHLGSRWGVRARAEQGAARVFSLGLLTRFGVTR
ncbi:MAG TPA: hypothetical protein VFU21_23530 [Kofleriaceae bacterium]|nr:hypothetical protein [Kofleriaceae bacterium]